MEKSKIQNRQLAPYIFISPFFVLFIMFMAYPLISSVWISMFQTRGFKSRVFVGLDNFVQLIHDPLFWRSLFNTAYFAAGSLLVQLPIALLLALVLNSKLVRGKSFFRLSFFTPVLVSGVFIAIIFYLLYDRRYGLVNRLIGSEIQWLQDKNLVMPAIIVAGVWRWAGFNMVYFLAGLQSIRQELYEAAAVDGANSWQSFIHITLPSLKPIIMFVTITSMIGSFQLFDLPYVLTGGGGPDNSGSTIVMYLYKNGFQFMKLGYAAAIGWVLVAIIALISMVQLKLFGIFKE